MPNIPGWFCFNHTCAVTATIIDFLTPNHNCLIVKNTDGAIAVWIRPSKDAGELAVANATHSFRLAAGESIHLEGLDVQWLSAIAESGTPVIKGVTYNRIYSIP